MTSLIEHSLTSPRRDRARVVHWSRPLESKGAGKAGYRLIPMAPVQQKARGRNHRFSRDIPAFPARWSTPYTCSPQEPGFFAPVASRSFCSLDLSVGRPGPHDFVVRINAVRPRETIARVANASIASRLGRDDSAYAPLTEAGPAHHASDFRKSQVCLRKTEQAGCDRMARRAVCAWRLCAICPSCARFVERRRRAKVSSWSGSSIHVFAESEERRGCPRQARA